jgi:hypothetical protein
VKRNPKGAKRREPALQVWTFAQALAAVPYIVSVVRSIREHALEALSQARNVRRLANRPGRRTRDDLIAVEEAEQAARHADDKFQDAVAELQSLDIYSLDPIQGLALVPFVHEDQLAWYIFDIHDSPPFRFWRYQTDPEETRRPITSMQRSSGATRMV